MPVARGDARSLSSPRPRIKDPTVARTDRVTPVPSRPTTRTLTRAVRRVPVAVAAIAFADVVPTDAAEPSPRIIDLIDPRTADLPELASGPVEVLVAVVALGVVTALATIGWLLVADRLGRRGAGRQ